MTRDEFDDEEAFHWAGDEVGGREGARIPGEKVPDAGLTRAVDVATEVAGPRSGAAGTLVTGFFGLVFLALTIGWILSVQYTGSGSTDLVTEVLWQFGEFTAIVAAPLWFGATLTLTRGGRPVTRAGLLALGAGLLVPWPLLPLLAAVSA